MPSVSISGQHLVVRPPVENLSLALQNVRFKSFVLFLNRVVIIRKSTKITKILMTFKRGITRLKNGIKEIHFATKFKRRQQNSYD